MRFVQLIFWAIVIALIGIAISFLRSQASLTYSYGGYVAPGYESVEKAFRENFEHGYEPDGAAFAACHNGKMVVDLWGGYADKHALRVWKEDTLSTAFSVTKGISSLCIAMLVDRGLLSYDDLVTKYWPEFGAQGKANVTVKMLIGHEAGLAILDEPITKETIKDWRLMSKIIENQKPNWLPGSKAGYHLLTHGFITDQLLRRVDPKHRSIGRFFKEEIAEPYGIDFYIGLPRDQLYRASRITNSNLWDFLIRLDDWQFVKFIAKAVTIRTEFSQSIMKNPEWMKFGIRKYTVFNDPDVHEMEIPAANGIGTARALAQLYCLLGDKTKPLLSKPLLDKIFTPVIKNTPEAIFGLNFTWGHGFMHRTSPNGHYQLGHPGHGGQNAKYDKKENLAFAYLRNNVAPEAVGELVRTYRNLEYALYDSTEKMKTNKL